MIWLILLLSWGCSIFWLSDSNIMHSIFDLARILVCNLKRKTIVVKSLPSHYISQFFFCILLPCCFLCCCSIWSDKIYLDNCSTRFDVSKIDTIFIVQSELNVIFDICILNVYQYALKVAIAIRSLSNYAQTITM